MIGLREICALLLGGAVSVPATVVVVRDLPAKNARAQTPAKVKPASSVSVPREKFCIEHWPGVGLGDFTMIETGPGLIPVPPAGPGGVAELQPGPTFLAPHPPLAGPWPLPGVPDVSIPPAPPIPEPAQWLMLLAGFGLVGLAGRARNSRPTKMARRARRQP